MKSLRTWWRGEPVKRKILFGVAGGVFVTLVVASVVALFLGERDAGDQSTPTQDTEATPPLNPPTEGEEESPVEDGISIDGEWDASGLSLGVDEFGMVEMPITDDPYEAAAAAAAVAYSVDTTKLPWEEFVDTAIQRMTLWSTEGPVDGFHGPAQDEIGHLFINEEWWTLAPWQHINGQVHEWQRANPDYWNWWHLSQETHYAEMALVEATWKAQPLEVYSAEAMLSEGVDGVSRDADRDWKPDRPGATLGDYWVAVQVEESYQGEVYNEMVRYAIVSIWCDPPEEGGVCAVAEIVDGPMPEKWQG